MALISASISPTAISVRDLWGKNPRLLSLSPETSTIEVSDIPSREARTPPIFIVEGFSILANVPIIRVHIPDQVGSDSVYSAFTLIGMDLLLVEHKIVELPTLVYIKLAVVK